MRKIMRKTTLTQTAENLAEVARNARALTESSIVGGMLLWFKDYPALVAEVFAVCPVEAFTDTKAAAIAKVFWEACSAGEIFADIADISRAFRRLNLLPESESTSAAIAEVMQLGAMTSTEVLRQAEILAGEYRKQRASALLDVLLRECQTFGGRPAEQIAEDAKILAAALEAGALAQHRETLGEQLDEYLRDLAEGRNARPVPSPWQELNRVLRGGIMPGELAILAARPSVGKSALALNWAFSVACSGAQVPFISLEMPRAQLFDRLFSNVANVHAEAFRNGLTPQQRERVSTAAGQVREKTLLVRDAVHVTLSGIRRQVYRAAQFGPVGLVVVDYLQLMVPEKSTHNREREVAEISRGMKLLAKEFKVPVLLLAQLNRSVEQEKREPRLSDLRESGAIEQDADIVMFLHAARLAWNENEPVKVIVAKGRSSGVGSASLIFRRGYQRFEDSSAGEFTRAAQSERALFDAPDLA